MLGKVEGIPLVVQRHPHARRTRRTSWVVAIALMLLVPVFWFASPAPSAPAPIPMNAPLSTNQIPLGVGTNYSTYLDEPARTNDVGDQGPFNASNIHELRVLWQFTTGAAVLAQSIVVNGIVYVGSSDGYEYALYATNGTLAWKTFLGISDTDTKCKQSLGVTSTATYSRGLIYVSDTPDFYALNASTGAIAWNLTVSGTNTQGFYLWASPLIYDDSVYVGLSSQCDHPLVSAGLARVSLLTHEEIAYFNTSVPDANGSSIWGSPALSLSENSVLIATGNAYRTDISNYSNSIVELNAVNLSMEHTWQVPLDEITLDGDFGITPTVFNLSNGVGVVAGENKDGYLYELYQSNLTQVWQDHIANMTGDHFSAAFGDGTLYAVANAVTIGTHKYKSTISAVNPDNGAYLWRVGTNLPLTYEYAAPLVDGNLLIVPVESTLYVLNRTTGAILFQRAMGGIMTPSASLSRGEIFIGLGDSVEALGLALHVTTTHLPKSGAAPLTVAFTSAPTGGVAPYSYNWSFGDGTYSSIADPSHVFSSSGSFEVNLTVTDLTGAVATTSFSIAVSSPRRP